MKFLLEINVPEARKDEIVPEEMETMFQEFAMYYKEKREKGIKMKHTAIHIRDGEPSISLRLISIKTQGDI